jgi:hypothetical protein
MWCCRILVRSAHLLNARQHDAAGFKRHPFRIRSGSAARKALHFPLLRP